MSNWLYDETRGHLENLEKGYGQVYRAYGDSSNRQYLDVETDISVRDDYTDEDFRSFRTSGSDKSLIEKCINIYRTNGIIKNVIDLMGDFASQGITLHHKVPHIQRFYRAWWAKVNGQERSERFLNMLYRSGNVIIYKTYATLKEEERKRMIRAEDATGRIPVRYTFMNPLDLEVSSTVEDLINGRKIKYKRRVSTKLSKLFSKNNKVINDSTRSLIDPTGKYMDLPADNVSSFFYKRDDWRLWADPMISAIADDIDLYDRMKLADKSALDGAISNIRLWILGSLEHKIVPDLAAVNKLRNVLAANTGGGAFDLVWGPDIQLIESKSEVYKFLGDEKYKPVLNSIYVGLGIPPALAGLAGQGGGFTNNFISLKTLIERLEYGRMILRQFLEEEISYVQESMGFATPAKLHFEHMILSDESAEKKLLMDLLDRDVISVETVRDRFNELNDVETVRINKEHSKREKGKLPRKADPYHSEPKQVDEGGRPKNSKDQIKRKQKVVNPKSTPTTPTTTTANLMIWTNGAQKFISNCVNTLYLDKHGKQTLRELTTSQLSSLEKAKFSILCNLQPHQELDKANIIELFDKLPEITINQTHKEIRDRLQREFISLNNRNPTIDELRQIYGSSYVFAFFE